MARYEFKSVFADEIQKYINDKNSAGYNGANFRQNLISFDRFCTEQEIKEPVFTTYHALLAIEWRVKHGHRQCALLQLVIVD